MKANLTFLLLVVAMQYAFAQFSVESYLAAPFHEAEITGLLKQMEYVKDESFRSPLFRELELRLRSNDFNLSPEDYRIRLGFMNPVEQVRNRKYKDVQAEYLESKYTFETNFLLAGRYKHLARHFYLTQQKAQLLDDIRLLELTSEHLQDGRKLKSWIDADESQLKKELKLAEINTAIELLDYIMKEIQGSDQPVNWDGFEMIPIQKMKQVLFSDTVNTSIEVMLARQSLKLDEQAYKIEKAEAFNNIGFIQAEYDTERGDNLNDHLGFQLGVLIPLFNPDKPQLKREMLELMESENEVIQKQEEADFDRQTLYNRFAQYRASWEMVTHRLASIEKLSNGLSYENAEEYLAMIKYLAYLQELKNEYYIGCLTTYIDLLALSGSLSKEPLLNYIDKDLTAFSF